MINLTLIGNAVYMSMDIPDMVLAVSILRLHMIMVFTPFNQCSKLLNYIQWNRAKVASFATFVCVWT